VPNIIVIGASAGGVQALKDIVRHLPVNLQAAIFVVVHMSCFGPSVLAEILNTAGNLHAAALDRHLLIEPGFVRLTRGPQRESLPAGDRSAVSYRRQSIWAACAGVILTGRPSYRIPKKRHSMRCR
jgi:two-component system chemotaxis response regulator CheB